MFIFELIRTSKNERKSGADQISEIMCKSENERESYMMCKSENERKSGANQISERM